MTDDTQKAEELLQDSTNQRRTDTSNHSQDQSKSLVEAVADAFDAIDENEKHNHISVRDDRLAALFHGLEDADELERVIEQAAAQLGKDTEELDARKSTAYRLLLRVAIQEVDDELLEQGKDGYRKHQREKVDDF
jgi:hypothetical protein